MSAAAYTNGSTGHGADADIDTLYSWFPPPQPAAAPLPEAPASCNVYLQISGHKVQVTLRDVDEHRMLGRLQVLLEQYPAAPEKTGGLVAQTLKPAPVCEWHGPMKPSTKHGGWYCPAKMGDGSYCKARQGA